MKRFRGKLALTPARGGGPLIAHELPVTIGRGEDASLRILDPWVSRNHCEILASDEQVIVRDTGSRHGICVNDEIVQESPLHEGDTLRLGTKLFTIQWL